MFRFRLETLLRVRISERDQRRADLAKALRAEQLLLAEQARLREQQAAAQERGRALKAPGAANVDAILETHRYELVLIAQIGQLASQLTQVQAECERRRQALVEADRQVRVLEKLRDRQAAAHKSALERREAKQLDELALLGFVYRQEAPT